MKAFDLVLMVLTLAYGVILKLAPDFPLSQDTFITLMLFVLGRLGYHSAKAKKAGN